MHIPSEIVRLIVEAVEDTQSLVTLTRVSKQFQMEAERLLYRSLTEEDGTKSYKCLSSVKKFPQRAAYVRAYHVHTTVHKQHRSMWNLIHRTLPLMVNLKELVFRHEIGGRPLTAIFPAKYTPQLEKFVWSVAHGNPYQYPAGPKQQSYVSQALKFLEGQTQLRLLHWQPGSQPDFIPNRYPDSVFPQLNTFIGDIAAIQTCLPGRDSITTLQWLAGLETPRLLEEVFDSLSPQLRRLKYLSIQPLNEIFWLDSFLLRPMIPHLHSLETLQVLSLSDFGINEALPKLRKLKKLIMTSLVPWEEVHVKLIFSQVQSLEFLYMGQVKINGGKWGFKYSKWARESVLRGDMAPQEEVLTHVTDV